jgi:hypothetical protein
VRQHTTNGRNVQDIMVRNTGAQLSVKQIRELPKQALNGLLPETPTLVSGSAARESSLDGLTPRFLMAAKLQLTALMCAATLGPVRHGTLAIGYGAGGE